MFGNLLPHWMLPMTMLTASQRQILEDIASGKTTWWQEAPDVFGDHQMLYEAGLIDGAPSYADDGFGLLEMRLTLYGQTVLAQSVEDARPSWKRWTFWHTLIASVGSCILFVVGVLTFWNPFV